MKISKHDHGKFLKEEKECFFLKKNLSSHSFALPLIGRCVPKDHILREGGELGCFNILDPIYSAPVAFLDDYVILWLSLLILVYGYEGHIRGLKLFFTFFSDQKPDIKEFAP